MEIDNKNKVVIPHIHLNGTSRESLLNAYCEAYSAVRIALDGISNIAPNGRDYYITDNFKEAVGQYDSWVNKLKQVQQEIADIIYEIDK